MYPFLVWPARKVATVSYVEQACLDMLRLHLKERLPEGWDLDYHATYCHGTLSRRVRMRVEDHQGNAYSDEFLVPDEYENAPIYSKLEWIIQWLMQLGIDDVRKI